MFLRAATLCLCSLFVPVFTADGADTQFPVGEQIRIEIAETIDFRKLSELDSLCRAGYAVKGCTDFTRREIESDCVQIDASWRLTATARLHAILYLSSPRILRHERQHVSDVRESLTERLVRLGVVPHPTERSCRHMAEIISSPSYSSDVINRILQESTMKRQCRLRPM